MDGLETKKIYDGIISQTFYDFNTIEPTLFQVTFASKYFWAVLDGRSDLKK